MEAAALQRRLAEVERQLVEAAGGASLCAISRSGGQVDGVKYLEGRLAALLQLRRVSRRGERDPDAALQEALAEWTTQLDQARSGSFGRGWLAYRAGGVDELTELGSPVDGSGAG